MTTQPSPYSETVKRTPLPEQNIEVVTLQRHDSNLLRPYLVFARDVLSGEASGVADFSCAASALHAHATLFKQLQKMERRTTAPSSSTLNPNPRVRDAESS